jgi:hypothetical protein
VEWAEEGLLAMGGYTKWDRAAYIERVGGEPEAERRRVALAEDGLAAVAEWAAEHGPLTDAERTAVDRQLGS